MGQVIAIDLGGTSVYGGLIDREGKILARAERSSAGSAREEVLKRISQVIDDLMTDDILGIGLGSPGFIDSDKGRVLAVGGNIKGWAGTDIRGYLAERYDLPIFLDNDANVAALGELWLGAARDMSSFIMLTLGTGVGGAIYYRQEGIISGHNFQGAELGHAILYPAGDPCPCGQSGCVERYVSGSSVERLYEERTSKKMKGKDIFPLSLTDKATEEFVDEFAYNMAICLVSFKNIFDPQAFVIGGGVINSREYWWQKMMDHYRKNSNDPDNIIVKPAEFLNDAGMIGAGKLVFDKLDEKESDL